MDYLERGMQKIKLRVAKLQQYHTRAPVISRTGSRPKKIIDQQDDNLYGQQGRNQEIYNS